MKLNNSELGTLIDLWTALKPFIAAADRQEVAASVIRIIDDNYGLEVSSADLVDVHDRILRKTITDVIGVEEDEEEDDDYYDDDED